MKRLLFLTILSAIASGGAGCSHFRSRGAQCRPVCMPAPVCTPACGGPAMEAYSTPGVITTGPTVVMPQGAVPGPETYAPAIAQ